MSELPEPFADKNSRGLGLMLRFAGVILPLAAFFALLFRVDRYGVSVLGDGLSGVFRVLAFLWAWPYAVWDYLPLSFGALALLGLAMSAILFIRRDWRGAVAILLWSLFWGWLIAALIGQD